MNAAGILLLVGLAGLLWMGCSMWLESHRSRNWDADVEKALRLVSGRHPSARGERDPATFWGCSTCGRIEWDAARAAGAAAGDAAGDAAWAAAWDAERDWQLAHLAQILGVDA